MNAHFIFLSVFLSDGAALKYCSNCLVCVLCKWHGHVFVIHLLYKSSALKVLVEIRKVKETNLWSLSDQSLCLWGQTKYRILDDSIGYCGIASLEALTGCFFAYGWLRQMWLVSWLFLSFGVIFKLFCGSVVRLLPEKFGFPLRRTGGMYAEA